MKCFILIIVIGLTFGQNHCFSQELPIKPARTISFKTDEGSYMNIDASPDGKTLVFDLLGDLYTVPVTGGAANQLTRGVAINLRPIWSPNGKRIAYISDISGAFHLNVRDVKGPFHCVLGKADEALKDDKNAIWLPGSNYVAIDGHVYAISGGQTENRGITNFPIRFSTDGHLLYGVDSGKLSIYNFKTVKNILMTSDLPGLFGGTLSPNGRWWIFITQNISGTNNSLMVEDLTNHKQHELVHSLFKQDTSYMPFLAPAHFSFSPDSKKIYIGFGGKIHCLDVESRSDIIIPFIADVKADLGPFNHHTFRVTHDSVNVKYTRNANASPDGKHLVFSALDKLYVMELPNGKPRVIASQKFAQFQPVFSPDSKWIAYVSWCDTVGGYLWRVSTKGGQPEQLTTIPGQYQRPAWSNNGKLIAVIKGAPKLGDRDDIGKGQLELIPVKGGAISTIDSNVPLWNQIAFSADDKKIIYQPKFYGYRSENSILLISKDINGKDSSVIAIGPRMQTIQNRFLSPDGRYIVFSGSEDVYLLPVCKLTMPQVIYDKKQQLPLIQFAHGVDPFWEKGGKILSWSYSNHFYRVDPDKIVANAERIAQKKSIAKTTESTFITAIVKPDQDIPLNVTVPDFYAHGFIVLKNVRIITMQGDQVIEKGTIIIKDGRFLAIGPNNTTLAPRGAKEYDLSGKTIMPGLIDLHLHMRLQENIFPQQSWMYLANLAYGVTTARDPSANYDSFGCAELLQSGQMFGPRLFSVGRAVGIEHDAFLKLTNRIMYLVRKVYFNINY